VRQLEQAKQHEDRSQDGHAVTEWKEQATEDAEREKRDTEADPPPCADPAIGGSRGLDGIGANPALVDDESQQETRREPEREPRHALAVPDDPAANAVDRLSARLPDDIEHECEQHNADQVHAVPLDEPAKPMRSGGAGSRRDAACGNGHAEQRQRRRVTRERISE